MGFLDRLFGRSKEKAGDAADKVEPVVDKAQDAAGEGWEKAKDTAGDVADEATGTAEEAKDTVSDAPSAGDPPGPSAA